MRTNGKVATLTYKDIVSNTIDGTKEVEFEIQTYMEIEGKSEKEIIKVKEILNIDESKVTTLNCDDIYKQIYKIDISKIKELKF